MVQTMFYQSTMTYPECGHEQTKTMPSDVCQWFYGYRACRVLPQPKPGDCCVFCSYATVPCPPVQQSGKSCCSHGGSE